MSQCRDAVTATDGGVVLQIDVSAGAGRALFPAGYNRWRHRIRCQVTAQPRAGKANRMVVSLIAEFFTVSEQRVTIVRGHTSSQKAVQVAEVGLEDVVGLIDGHLP